MRKFSFKEGYAVFRHFLRKFERILTLIGVGRVRERHLKALEEENRLIQKEKDRQKKIQETQRKEKEFKEEQIEDLIQSIKELKEKYQLL